MCVNKKTIAFFCLNCLMILIVGVSNVKSETIISFGDSITTGWPYINYPPNGERVGGYEPNLETLLANIGHSSQVLNYGVPGETTAEGVNRIDDVLSLHKAHYVLLMEATNDILLGVSAHTTVFNLGVMIDKCHSHEIEAIIATLTPNSEKDVNAGYNPAINLTASQRGAKVADQYGALAPEWETLSDDGLHPNEAGYQVMAQTWFDTLGLTPQGVDDGGGGGCFIATAAYGSSSESSVKLLRRFRDNILLDKAWGRAFVDLYYRWSPKLADIIAEHDFLRLLVRLSLIPLIAFSWLSLGIGFVLTLLISGVFSIAFVVATYCLLKTIKTSSGIRQNQEAAK